MQPCPARFDFQKRTPRQQGLRKPSRTAGQPTLLGMCFVVGWQAAADETTAPPVRLHASVLCCYEPQPARSMPVGADAEGQSGGDAEGPSYGGSVGGRRSA